MNRLGVFIIALFLLIPSGVSAEWLMFGNGAERNFVADITERTIQKRTPVPSWDRGSSSEEVYSWGTAIGNFTSNIGGDPYDRNVLHVVYVTAEEDGDWLKGYLEIRDGGNPGKLMWQRDLGNIKNQNNQSLQNDFESYDAAFGTPVISDFDDNGLMDVAVVTTNGIVQFFEPEIEYDSSNVNYDQSNNGETWSYSSGFTVVRTNPAVTSFNGGNDLVISGIDIDNDEIAVVAVDGATGEEIWAFEQSGTEVSSPAVYEDGSSRKVFVSVYDNNNLEVYAIQGGSGVSSWNPKTIGSIVNPGDVNLHPMLPSIAIADITDEDSGKEIIVPQPAATDGGDSQLWVYTLDGGYAEGWDSAYSLDSGGDMDATPAVGDVDGDGNAEIVAITWKDPGSGNGELTTVWSINSDHTLDWETTYDQENSEGCQGPFGPCDDDEHAIASPVLAVIYTGDGEDNLDVFTCTTPYCHALDGNDGGDGGGAKDSLWDIRLEGRQNDNRIFTSPAASDVDGDGLLDFIVDGAVYSADLADLTLRSSDITMTDSGGEVISEIEEGQSVKLSIDVRNEGNHDALDVDIEVRLDTFNGALLHSETIDIQANSIQDLEDFTWVSEGQGEHKFWVMCLVNSDDNEEVRYDNNNASKTLLVRPQYGLELAVKDSSKTVDVNNAAVFDLNVTNMGLQLDNYNISVEVMSPQWDISFPSIIESVESNTTSDFQVSFTPKDNVTAAQHLFTITATSQGNISRSDSTVVGITLNQYYGIEIVMPLDFQKVFPGNTLFYPVKITNEGNGEDTFDLYTSSDWGAQIRIDGSPSGEISLAPFRSVDAELKVVVPDTVSVNDFKEIPFTAISQGDNSISISKISNTSIGIMRAENAVRGILPGGSSSFNFEFLNPTNSSDNFTLSILSGAPAWDISISPEITVESSVKGTGTIEFFAPNTAEPGTSFEIVVGFGNDEILDQITVVLEVNNLQGIRIWSIDDKFSEFASPGETVFFDVRVVNYESQEQDVDLSYNSDDLDGWSIVFNNQTSWSKILPSGSSTSVSIGVTPPSSESVDTVDLEIKGTTPGFLPVYFYSNITVNQEFGVSVGSKSIITLLGNVSELVKIFVTNTGNGPDVFDVTYYGEWVENNTVSYAFEGFETREISIPVNSGLVAPGSQSSVAIIVNSTKSKLAGDAISDSSTLDFVVTGIKPVSSQSISLQSGQTASVDLAILSLNSLGEPTSRVITEVTGDAYWWASFDNTEEFEDEQTLIVSVGEPQVFSATVSVPEGAQAGSYSFILKVTDYNEQSHVSTLKYTVNVLQEYNITFTLQSTTTEVNPGDTATWSFLVMNNGNGVDAVTLSSLGVPAIWVSEFDASNFELASQPPSPTSKFVTLTMEVPLNETSGEYNFEIVADSLGNSQSISLNLSINAVYQLGISVIGDSELVGQAGQSIYFQFEVTNLGNSDDEYTLTSTGSMISQATPNNFGWSSKIVGYSLSETNYLKVTVPQSNDGPWNAVVTVASTGNPALTNSIKFTLTGQVLPDATIRDLTLTPSNPKPDERVTARFSIFAEDADLDSIYYTVYLDNNVIGGDRVFGIESNGFETVSFSFTASEGDHVFKVKLDELGDISESDITNNEIEQSFTVEAESGSNLVIYVIVVIVAAVAGAVYYKYSKKGVSPRLSIKKKPVISDKSIKFPIILNCLQCSSRVRVARPGSFRCPSCKSVSDVDANGEIELTERADNVEEETEEKSSMAVPKEEEPKEKSKSRLSRMEQFLSGNNEKVNEKKSKGPKLSASEKLKLLKEESDSKTNSSQEVEEVEEESGEVLSDDEPKRSKKRKSPPKGGSFGPSVGGF
ncbi:MAG: CARDB domain-containing protein [Candidatus Thermoplasmatota archaeon]|nr:CARDB domain-containing protein [Candidatus Thermoplasmatota archaeon]